MKRKVNFKKVMKFAIIIYIAYIFISQQLTMKKIQEQITVKKAEVQELQDKNRRLQDEVKMSDSDMYIEKMARERLGLIRKDEMPVINSK